MALSVVARAGEELRPEWEQLLARAARPSPFLSPAFLLPWTSSFADSRPVRVVRWERDGRAEGLLFLYLAGDGGEWELLGGEQVADSLDLLVAAGRDAEFWEAFRGLTLGSPGQPRIDAVSGATLTSSPSTRPRSRRNCPAV